MNILAIVLLLVSQAIFNLNPVILKTNTCSFIYKVLFSTLTLVIPSLVYFKINDKNYLEDLKVFLLNKNTLLSSFSYFLYTVIYFYSQQVLPITIALPVFMLYPFILMLLNRVLNLESINIGELIGGVITFIGIVVLSNSPLKNKPSNYRLKLLLCMVSGVFCALAYVLLKTGEKRVLVKEDSLKIKKLQEKQTNLFNIHANMLLMNFIPTVLFLIIFIAKNLLFKNKYNDNLLFKGKNDTKSLIKLLVISFGIQYISNLLTQYSLINLPPAIYSALLNSSVMIAFIYGKFFFNETVNLQKIIGCLVILTGISFNIYSSGQIETRRDYLFIKR